MDTKKGLLSSTTNWVTTYHKQIPFCERWNLRWPSIFAHPLPNKKQTEPNRSATWHRICAVFQQDPNKVQTGGMTSFVLADAGALVRSGLHFFLSLKDPRFSSYDHTLNLENGNSTTLHNSFLHNKSWISLFQYSICQIMFFQSELVSHGVPSVEAD